MEINGESSASGYCILPVSILRNLNVLATSLSQLEVIDEAIQSMEKDYVVLEMTKSSDGSIAFEDVSTADAAAEILMQYDIIRKLTSFHIREDLVEMFAVVVRHQELQRGLLEMRMCFTENRWWAERFRDLCQRLAWAFDDACFVAEEDSGPSDGCVRPSLFGGVRDCVVLTSPGVEIICGEEKKACWSFSWEVWDAVQRREQFVGAATSVANVNAIWPSMATCR